MKATDVLDDSTRDEDDAGNMDSLNAINAGNHPNLEARRRIEELQERKKLHELLDDPMLGGSDFDDLV
jgi:hypothetical protein